LASFSGSVLDHSIDFTAHQEGETGQVKPQQLYDDGA
jgi:hypothetical protein